MKKDIHIYTLRHYETLRNTGLIVLGLLLLAFGFINYQRSTRLLERVETLSQQNKQLSEQNKQLNKDNKQLNKDTQDVVLQNRDCIRGIAQIFANYTHDFIPVDIENLETCKIKTGESTPESSSGGETAPANASPVPSNSSSSQNAPSQNPSQSEIPQEPEDEGILPNFIPILGPLL